MQNKVQENLDKTLVELDKIDGVLDFCVQSLYNKTVEVDKTNLIYILEMLQEKIHSTKEILENDINVNK